MVAVAQLVRASDCGSEGRGFETHHPPEISPDTGESVAGSGLFHFFPFIDQAFPLMEYMANLMLILNFCDNIPLYYSLFLNSYAKSAQVYD